ncbi:hypothetical protein DITRI_Ditri05aG0101100 [Diplodiscus trichospermus]
MAEEKHHRHLFHHHKDDDKPVETSDVYSETVYSSDTSGVAKPEVDYKKEEKHHKHLEHLGELGTAGATAFALHEKHKAEKDPDIMRRKKQRKKTMRLMERSTITFSDHNK